MKKEQRYMERIDEQEYAPIHLGVSSIFLNEMTDDHQDHEETFYIVIPIDAAIFR